MNKNKICKHLLVAFLKATGMSHKQLMMTCLNLFNISYEKEAFDTLGNKELHSSVTIFDKMEFPSKRWICTFYFDEDENFTEHNVFED